MIFRTSLIYAMSALLAHIYAATDFGNYHVYDSCRNGQVVTLISAKSKTLTLETFASHLDTLDEQANVNSCTIVVSGRLHHSSYYTLIAKHLLSRAKTPIYPKILQIDQGKLIDISNTIGPLITMSSNIRGTEMALATAQKASKTNASIWVIDNVLRPRLADLRKPQPQGN